MKLLRQKSCQVRSCAMLWFFGSHMVLYTVQGGFSLSMPCLEPDPFLPLSWLQFILFVHEASLIPHLPNSCLLRLLGAVLTPTGCTRSNAALKTAQVSPTDTAATRHTPRKTDAVPQYQGNSKRLTRSSAPRINRYRTPGQSCARPPRTSTTLCCWMLWPSPGMYAVTCLPVDSRRRAILRSPELGFLGFWIPTRRHTPFACGAWVSARAGETAWRARRCFRIPCKEGTG
jgi:hypothetical protein